MRFCAGVLPIWPGTSTQYETLLIRASGAGGPGRGTARTSHFQNTALRVVYTRESRATLRDQNPAGLQTAHGDQPQCRRAASAPVSIRARCRTPQGSVRISLEGSRSPALLSSAFRRIRKVHKIRPVPVVSFEESMQARSLRNVSAGAGASRVGLLQWGYTRLLGSSAATPSIDYVLLSANDRGDEPHRKTANRAPAS
jgi:hypothetical protein